jgi:Cu-Zn family superoxide dismutase
LLAELATGASGSFLNDVWVGPDGAAYVTDSSLPVIWRVSHTHGAWRIDRWRDVSPEIAYTPSPVDFDLGGIVSTADRRYLLLTQGTTGQLWRIDLRTREIVEVDLGGARLTDADGIVLRGHTLWVVQNFSRQISKLTLHHHYRRARVEEVLATPADRTFTTAKLIGNRLLVVDSKFGFPPAAAVAEDRIVTVRAF